MKEFRILVNGRPVNITLAAAREGIINKTDDIQTVAISLVTSEGELILESNVNPNATGPEAHVYLQNSNGDPNAGPEIDTLFLKPSDDTIPGENRK